MAGVPYYDVTIYFKNGERAELQAQEFDIDVGWDQQNEAFVETSSLRKFTYKDKRGEDVPLYLTLDEVSGMTVTPHTGSGA